MSGQCHNLCSKKPKQVRMYIDADGKPIYLCAPCSRELGYSNKS